VLLFSGFGSGPETLRELGEAIRGRCGATVRIASLARHGGDTRHFLGSRSWHYLVEAEQRFLQFAAGHDTPVVIGGYSTGAVLALLILARHPSRIAGLVLASPTLRLSRTEQQLVAYTVVSAYYVAMPAALLAMALAIVSRSRARAWRRHRSLLAVLGTCAVFASAALALRRVTIVLEGGAPVTREGEDVLPPHFERASLLAGSTLVPLQIAARWELKRIARPVCFIFGEQDRVVDVRFGTVTAARTRLGEIHVLPGAPHRVCGLEDCQQIVAAFVDRTLSEAAAGSTE
jgi:pimeloyl-ACP methyl ester carboxylesterase